VLDLFDIVVTALFADAARSARRPGCAPSATSILYLPLRSPVSIGSYGGCIAEGGCSSLRAILVRRAEDKALASAIKG
jgi:hypothetical protein